MEPHTKWIIDKGIEGFCSDFVKFAGANGILINHAEVTESKQLGARLTECDLSDFKNFGEMDDLAEALRGEFLAEIVWGLSNSP